MLCVRCREPFGPHARCAECGVHCDRIVRRIRRNRPIGGKRGRNSGNVSSGNKKKGR